MAFDPDMQRQAAQIAISTMDPEAKRAALAELTNPNAGPAPPTDVDSGAVAGPGGGEPSLGLVAAMNQQDTAAAARRFAEQEGASLTHAPVHSDGAPGAPGVPNKFTVQPGSRQPAAAGADGRPPNIDPSLLLGAGGSQGPGAAHAGPPPISFAPARYGTVGTNTFQPAARATTDVTKPGLQVQPEDLENLDNARDQLDAARSGLTQAQTTARKGEQQAQAEAEAKQADYRYDLERAKQERSSRLDAQLAKSQQALTDYQHASEIDPDHYWANKSTGGKIAALLGVALSGLGMTAAGQPGKNPAMDQINAEIQRDIAAQRANLAKKGKDLEAQNSMLGIARGISDRADAQDAWATQAAIKNVQQELTRQVDRANNPVVAAKAQVLQQQLEEQRAEAQLKLGAAMQDETTTSSTTQERFDRKRTVASGGGLSDPWLRVFHGAKRMGLNNDQAQQYADRYVPNHALGGAAGAAGGVLSPLEKELGISKPVSSRSGVGAQIRDANKDMASGAALYNLNEEWKRAEHDANDHYWDRSKAIKAKRLKEEAAALYARTVIGSSDQESQKAAAEHYPDAGFGNATLGSTIDSSAEATNQRILGVINGHRSTLKLKPWNMTDLNKHAAQVQLSASFVEDKKE